MLLFLQAAHIVGQVSAAAAAAAAQSRDSNPSYRCLWSGCKVFDRRSCSRSWLEKHVPTHGGRFAFACIVDGCRMRFSSQVRRNNNITIFNYLSVSKRVMRVN